MSPTTPNNVVPKDAPVDDTVDNTTQAPADTVETDAVETDTVETDAVETDAVQTDTVQTDAAQTDAAQTDAAQTDAAQTDAAQTDAAQTDAIQFDIETPVATAKVPAETAIEIAMRAPVDGQNETVVVILHNGPTADSTTNGIVRPVVIPDPPTLAFGELTEYTNSTAPEDFEDWVDYTLFCDDGPTIRVLCAKEIVNKCCTSYVGLDISQKLFEDHSGYFKALMRGPWKEASSRVLRLPEIRIEDFKRLHLTLLAGGAAPRIGKPTTVITKLVETFILADYFDMPVVKTWLKTSLMEYFENLNNWSTVYVSQIMHHVTGDAAEMKHQAKVMDFGIAYHRIHKLPAQQQIMDHEDLIRHLVGYCPRPLMGSVLSQLDRKFKDAVFTSYLLL